MKITILLSVQPDLLVIIYKKSEEKLSLLKAWQTIKIQLSSHENGYQKWSPVENYFAKLKKYRKMNVYFLVGDTLVEHQFESSKAGQ